MSLAIAAITQFASPNNHIRRRGSPDLDPIDPHSQIADIGGVGNPVAGSPGLGVQLQNREGVAEVCRPFGWKLDAMRIEASIGLKDRQLLLVRSMLFFSAP